MERSIETEITKVGWMLTEMYMIIIRPVPLEVVSQYLTGAFLNLLKWWIEAEMPYSPEQMDEMFQQLAMPGAWAVVDENWKEI
jgi:hypothetical protein